MLTPPADGRCRLSDEGTAPVPGINLTRDEAATRAELLRVDGYDVTLSLGDSDETFRSVTTVRFACRTPGSDTFIDLIAPTVSEVVLNGRTLPVDEVVSTARIALPGLAEQNELTVVAEAAYMRTGEGLHRFVDPVDQEVYLYSQFEVADARRVFACFDQPDLKGTYTFTITAPDHWQVVGVSPTPEPEPEPGQHPDGPRRATWRFAPTPRLSTYVTAVVAGPYHVVRSQVTGRDGRAIPLGVFCRASLAQYLDADNVVDITRAGFAHFEQLFDVDYPFAKYDQLFVPEFNAGAMENAGTVTITETYVFRSKVPEAAIERRALTILHELAHMWFGDLVTMRWWDDLWLNESFAEYASTRCQAESTRWRSAWTTFSSSEKSWAYRQDQLASTHPIVADIRDLADVEVNFDGITYAKGASVLKQLVHWVGAQAFDAGLRSYFRTHAWGNTRLADLLAELASASGRDLDEWAAQWLQTAGVATLSPLLERTADGRIASLAVLQAAPPEHPSLRAHRLAIGCYDLIDGRLQRTRRVELDVAGARTDVPELTGSPVPDLLLVNDDDLAYAKIRLDPASMVTAREHLADFADSLPRTLVWGAAWDMTRDAELGAREFIDLVLGNIASVDDPSVAQTLLRQLASTLAFYVAPEHRVPTVEAAADRLFDLLKSAEPGGDAQLLFARSFAAHAHSAGQLDAVRGLLAGTLTVDGLAVDTEMRWALLVCLAAGGAAGEADIDSELARDDTATGRVHAAAARAALPTADAKERAWQQVVVEGALPNSVQAAVIGGFGRVPDPVVLEPFVERYFEALVPVWQQRTNEMASQIVAGLYPALLAGPDLLERTDRWLAGTDAEPALRRLVVEARDGVVRAIRAQQRDRASAPTT
jgi:aminopeptidase N